MAIMMIVTIVTMSAMVPLREKAGGRRD